MSKSYNNTIPLFDTDKAIKDAIMGIVSDSTPLEAPKNPDTCNIYSIYRLFASEEQAQAMATKLRAGGYGYGHAKKELLEIYHATFDPLRKRRDELSANPDYVESVLRKSADKARHEARKTLDKVRLAVGLM